MLNNKATVVSQTRNQLFVNYDLATVFIWDNRYEVGSHANVTGAEEILPLGTVLGKTSLGVLQVLKSASVDGSEIPVGILAENITVAIGETVDLNYCIGGEVAAGQLVFDGADTLSTIIDGKSIADRLQSDTLGIQAKVSTDLTAHDNS